VVSSKLLQLVELTVLVESDDSQYLTVLGEQLTHSSDTHQLVLLSYH